MGAVHQFHSGSTPGDAVTNSMFLIQEILWSFGLVSEIFAEHVAPELADRIQQYSTYQPKPEDVMFIHHSMGHEQTKWILQLPVSKILVYHNITPPDFFPPESVLRHYSKIGRKQLRTFLPEMHGALAVSEYNARELRSCGYENVSVIPLLVDVESLKIRTPALNILESADDTFTILFVGRISPNKCQGDLIDILSHLQEMNDRPVQLVLVGGYEENDPYYLSLQEKIFHSGLEEQVMLTGKVSDEELTAWYRCADVFICMSEHEGFGVPLIEAMAFDLPVIAYKNSNVPFTMAGAGLVVAEKNMVEIAALVHILSKDRILRRAVINSQRLRMLEFSRDKLACSLYDYLKNCGISISKHDGVCQYFEHKQIHYQVEGPFETSYSLALVNRQLAFALNELDPGKVGLFATEGLGDYEPDIKAIEAISGLKELFDKGQKKSRADVVIRNLYPPRVADMDGLINLFYFAWEESSLHPDYVSDFNIFLDGMTVLSNFVKKVLINNGVHLPIVTAGCGFDHLKHVTVTSYCEELPSGYKFLHISSCFPRKGVDVLLKAFCEVFSCKDNVSLIIKTFPNIHNRVREQVDCLSENNDNCPNIKIIESDLPVGQIVDLYRQCDAFVAPSRGEGFGLPMAEAMWFGLPVITTGFGGQTDFCTDETSWLIDYSFEAAKTHLGLFDSVWAEPDANHLGQLMLRVWNSDIATLRPRLDAAREILQEKFSWKRCAEQLVDLEKRIIRKKPQQRKKIRLGWISSWNTRCGIAAYSKFLLEALDSIDFETVIFASSAGKTLAEDEGNVVRCWKNKNHSLDMLEEALDRFEPDVIVVQFNRVFYRLTDLARQIRKAKEKGQIVVIMFHVTKDLPPPDGPASLQSIVSDLSLADRLLVHGVEDLNRFKEWGLVENVALFPHGVQNRLSSDAGVLRKTYGIDHEAIVIASYGFLLPHKGLEELLAAFSILKQKNDTMMLVLVNALYPEPSPSRALKKRCKKLITKLGLTDFVIFETNFLSNQESSSLLGMADLIVFPYQMTSESSSAAVRHALSVDKPVAVTPLEIFSDVRDVVHFLPGTSVEAIAGGIEDLLFNSDKLFSKQAVRGEWLEAHSWNILGRRLEGMLKGLVEDNEC